MGDTFSTYLKAQQGRNKKKGHEKDNKNRSNESRDETTGSWADIGKGNITVVVIDPHTAWVTYTDYNGKPCICEALELHRQFITISGTSSGNRILIDANHTPKHHPVQVKLHSVVIEPPINHSDPAFCAFGLVNGASVRVLFSGQNNLMSGAKRTGIEVPHGCSLSIERPSDGVSTLTASSHGTLGGVGSSSGRSGNISISNAGESNLLEDNDRITEQK